MSSWSNYRIDRFLIHFREWARAGNGPCVHTCSYSAEDLLRTVVVLRGILSSEYGIVVEDEESARATTRK